jgi:hypothetical protein
MITIQNNNYKLEITESFDPENPRDNNPITKMICFHKKYFLGDHHNYNSSNYNNWEELKQDIIQNENPAIIKPLYLYDHSGITISTSSFNDPWDSGQIGFIFIPKESNIEENLLETIIQLEVSDYDNYLTGNVYNMILYKDDEIIEIFGDFYGEDFWLNGMSQSLPEEILTELEDELLKQFKI